MKGRESNYGFTIVELLVSVTILSMIALMGIPYLQSSKDREREMALRQALQRIRHAIELYAWNEDGVDNDGDGLYGEDPMGDPDGDGIFDDDRDGRLDEDGPPNYPPSLQALIDAGYISHIPRDPMSTDPTLPATQTWEVWTVNRGGADSSPGIFDIRSRCQRRAIDGTLYSEW